MENKESVKGIEKIKCIESLGGFDTDDIIKTIELHKDAILKVERVDVLSISRQSDDYAIEIYLNLRADKKKLIDAVVDMFKKFKAASVDLECDDGVRMLTFWWDWKPNDDLVI